METGKEIRRTVVWLPVLGRFTRVSILGNRLKYDPTISLSDFTGLIILMIPGNPGNEQFYDHFGQEVLSKISGMSEENSLFCTISHLNHVPMPREYSEMSISNCTDRIPLAEQIKHKSNFCLQYLTKKTKLILIGHSVGSYIMLRILPDLLKHEFSVVRCIALFPTIERLAESPNGERLLPWLKISHLDESLLHYSDRCRFLYGTDDRWSPLCYGLEMQKKLGKDLVIIDNKKCDHAFVLNHGEVVAHEVANWIIECYG
ncbi:unnamed protein product [Acanthocheilonema viteae]|uniref:Lipid droplet-associated hydrolase n=1 Tax=Acanthocheilonema viteae TaxID=6277 RepID=A0A498SN42_ACAVI|nr:unnamed protein product [Acanthocheilonema viteae]